MAASKPKRYFHLGHRQAAHGKKDSCDTTPAQQGGCAIESITVITVLKTLEYSNRVKRLKHLDRFKERKPEVDL